MKQIIYPSIMVKSQTELNGDFKKLIRVVKTLHLDVVDGKFAKNKTLQFPFKLSKQFNYQAHLMVKRPEEWIKKNWRRVDLFIPHIEEVKSIPDYIAWMEKSKRKVAFAILPETKVSSIKQYLNKIDLVLVLTVRPGFYGAKFLKSQLKKVQQLKKLNPKIKILVDGGMHPTTIKLAKTAGADFFVSGSYTTKADYPKERINILMNTIKSKK